MPADPRHDDALWLEWIEWAIRHDMRRIADLVTNKPPAWRTARKVILARLQSLFDEWLSLAELMGVKDEALEHKPATLHKGEVVISNKATAEHEAS